MRSRYFVAILASSFTVIMSASSITFADDSTQTPVTTMPAIVEQAIPPLADTTFEPTDVIVTDEGDPEPSTPIVSTPEKVQEATTVGAVVSGAGPEDLQKVVDRYRRIESFPAMGLSSSFIFGSVKRNGFGFPTQTIGISPLLGFDFKVVTNLPSEKRIEWAMNDVLQQSPEISPEVLYSEVRYRVNPGTFNYLQFGTEALVVPKFGIGTLVPLSRSDRNSSWFDIGVNFPVVLNMGLVFGF